MNSNSHTLGRVYRILDANANRASEGLRTVEECIRFVIEDSLISKEVKQIRHDLSRLLTKFDRNDLLSNRDVSGDVGRSITTESEKVRDDLPSIVAAASQRIQQSFRCLEEYAKLIDPVTAAEFEKLRYRTYALLAIIELRVRRSSSPLRSWLENAMLYVLVDCQRPLADFLARCDELSYAGVDLLQIRDKQCDTRTMLEYARELCDRLDPCRTRVIINDRVDIASALGCGVHLGQEDLPIESARRLLPFDQLIGISTHTLEQAIEAQRAGADYIGCGPTFASKTKNFGEFSGLDFLCQVSVQTTLPSFAIGGITLENLDDVLATGIHRVAVSHAIWQATNPADAAHAIAQKLHNQTCQNPNNATP
jgi:thiamine-phosphate pyrophosphorylase